jgi:hypothetical protein
MRQPGLMSSPASAAPSQPVRVINSTDGIGDCTVDGWLCVWTGPDFTGQMIYSGTVASGQCGAMDVYFPGARSAVNRTGQYARFWSNSNCTGSNYLLFPGWSSVGNFGFQANGLGGL